MEGRWKGCYVNCVNFCFKKTEKNCWGATVKGNFFFFFLHDEIIKMWTKLFRVVWNAYSESYEVVHSGSDKNQMSEEFNVSKSFLTESYYMKCLWIRSLMMAETFFLIVFRRFWPEIYIFNPVMVERHMQRVVGQIGPLFTTISPSPLPINDTCRFTGW